AASGEREAGDQRKGELLHDSLLFSKSVDAQLETSGHGESRVVSEDLDAVLRAHHALVQEVCGGELELQIPRQLLADRQVETMERFFVDVAGAAGSDFLDATTERVEEDRRGGP